MASQLTVENLRSMLSLLEACEDKIIDLTRIIELMCILLYFVIYPLCKIYLHFGIIAAEMPGIQCSNCILFISVSASMYSSSML